jgi:argonaute-like protein implicated in RNA metabolism and viral defense
LRIKDFYSDLETPELFVDHENPDRYKILSDNVETLFKQYNTIKTKLQKGYARYQEMEKKNAQLLRGFLEANYPEWLD